MNFVTFSPDMNRTLGIFITASIILVLQATQKPRNGGSEVSLGKWGSWTGPEEDKYSQMLLDKGQNCWNGPNRSARVCET